MSLRKIGWTSALIGFVTIMALPLSAQDLFDVNTLESDTEKVLKDYILTKPETDTKRFKDMKTLIIPQFKIGFETTRKGSYEESGVLIESDVEIVGLDEDMMQSLSDEVWQIILEEYGNGGYQVITTTDLMAHKDWSKRIKNFEQMPTTAIDENQGATMRTFVPTEFNNQYPMEFKQHELIGDHKDAILVGGTIHFKVLNFKGYSEGKSGVLEFSPMMQTAGAMGYAVVQKYRFGLYSGTFTKPLLFDASSVGVHEKTDKQEYSAGNKNILKTTYTYTINPDEYRKAVLHSARIMAKISVKNLQTKTG